MMIKPEYKLFWRILVTGKAASENGPDIDTYTIVKNAVENADHIAFSHLLKQLEPRFELSKRSEGPGEAIDRLGIDENQRIYDADVVIGLERWVVDELFNLDGYPGRLLPILGPVSQLLKEALEMWSLVGEADPLRDICPWHLISIEDHLQNTRYNSWVHLIELSRDLWLQAYEEDRTLALITLNQWKSWDFPLFKRLVLHACTVSDVYTNQEILEELGEKDGWWLWSAHTRREVFRLLNKIWSNLSESQADTLQNMVLQGAPRDVFGTGISDEEFQERQYRRQWLILSKLEEFGREVFGPVKDLLNEIKNLYPQWELQEGDRDEFTHWFEMSEGHRTDISEEELFDKDIEDRIALLSDSESESEYFHGWIDVYRSRGVTRTHLVVSDLLFLFRSQNWNPSIWRAALYSLSDAEDSGWSGLKDVVAELPDELYLEESWVIAWWSRKAAKSLSEEQDLPCLWRIATKIIRLLGPDNAEEVVAKDIVSDASSSPTGSVTEAAMYGLNLLKFKSGQGLSNEAQEVLGPILSGDGNGYVFARAILISRLSYFHSVDREWTNLNLLPLLDFNQSLHAEAYWRSYLWNAWVSPDLAFDFKDSLYAILKRYDEFESDEIQNLVSVFVIICVEFERVFSDVKMREILKLIGIKGLEEASRKLLTGAKESRGDDSEKRDNYWENRIKPFIKCWPAGGAYISSAISGNFARMPLALGDALPDAVETLRRFIGPTNHIRRFLHDLDQTDHVAQYPRDVFRVLTKIFEDRDENRWRVDQLETTLNKLMEADSTLSDELEFQKIWEFVLANKMT